MSKVADFGNDLYTGRRGLDYVGHRKVWFLLSGLLLAVCIGSLAFSGLNLGLEFRGGSEFRVSSIADTSGFETRAKDTVETAAAKAGEQAGNVTVTKVGNDSIRVQTEKLADAPTQAVSTALGQEFKVGKDQVSSTFVGPSWGQSVSQQALRALLIFFAIVAVVLAFYFRTWKMAAAALIAMLHDMVITVGLYTLLGFEITPATTIGFLTVLAYSLYDTVVVFDKVKENVRAASHTGRQTFSQAANLAVNQTLVRSINTSMMSVIPVTVVLIVGLLVIGPGVLLDLSLVLLVGILVGAYSSVFIATPVLAMLREHEPAMKEQAKRARRYQDSRGGANFSGTLLADLGQHGTHSSMLDPELAPATAPAGVTAGTTRTDAEAGTGGATSATRPAPGATATRRPTHPAAGEGRRPLHPSVTQGGPRNQPRRVPRSKR
ncbi:protein translocase subunit SecF [Arsenicicoccus sp. MKL-02]|uniref:Protein-export membrane protein SecF n=1 Tax=Arsenicicoccus cauae TaxID=2663847 RepID=A0A6I3IXG4_9MICO|nr:protein translocase subunit SecF [Arsenicicoccus cauae]MTB71606.1 protein translocase subunit SecF [Arsenicicoccus cauae]